MPATHAQPQVDPAIPGLQAVLTTGRAGHDRVDLIHMRAGAGAGVQFHAPPTVDRAARRRAECGTTASRVSRHEVSFRARRLAIPRCPVRTSAWQGMAVLPAAAHEHVLVAVVLRSAVVDPSDIRQFQFWQLLLDPGAFGLEPRR